MATGQWLSFQNQFRPSMVHFRSHARVCSPVRALIDRISTHSMEIRLPVRKCHFRLGPMEFLRRTIVENIEGQARSSKSVKSIES